MKDDRPPPAGPCVRVGGFAMRNVYWPGVIAWFVIVFALAIAGIRNSPRGPE